MICGVRKMLMSQSLRITTENRKSVNWWHQQTRLGENNVNGGHRLQKRKGWQLLRYNRGPGSECSVRRREVICLLPVNQQEREVWPLLVRVSKMLWSLSESRVSVPEEVGESLENKLRVTGSLFNEQVYHRTRWRNGTSGWIRLVRGCDSPC